MTATTALAEGCTYQRGTEARTVARLWDMPRPGFDGRQPMVDYRDGRGRTWRCTALQFLGWMREG